MPPQPINRERSEFGAWLDGMLRARSLSRTEFGARVGVEPSIVSHWTMERIPNPESCRKIADAFGIPHVEVLTRAGHIPPDASLDETDPTRARLIALVQHLDPEILKPHLDILERTFALINRRGPSE